MTFLIHRLMLSGLLIMGMKGLEPICQPPTASSTLRAGFCSFRAMVRSYRPAGHGQFSSGHLLALSLSLSVSLCVCLSVCLCYISVCNCSKDRFRQAFMPKPLSLRNKVQSVNQSINLSVSLSLSVCLSLSLCLCVSVSLCLSLSL